ncbi:alpha/beta hydrolase family protein [Streptosporangium carneum]|uniref:Lipase n=1 Tax=Streptosporangium carneum TaxID=47481 RepID=A0A9W6MDY1_9ACTN|nr:lipase [Streptosporangium carneum]GLK10557.1 lipase [Streptosporangium carneum]
MRTATPDSRFRRRRTTAGPATAATVVAVTLATAAVVTAEAPYPAVVPVAASAGLPAGLPATARTGLTLSLPAPTGGHPIGTVALHLVDRTRPDPLVRSKPHRELMVSLWYPAKKAPNLPLAPQMSRRAAADWDKRSAPPMGVKPGTVDWAATPTHARVGAPVDRRAGGLPVVVFSSGDGGPRTLGTVLVEELASRGYLVVSVDHTYEADQVEFPGGRVERAVPLPKKLTEDVVARLLDKHSKARLADMRFVLDQLAGLSRGRNPDAESTPLPAGLPGSADLTRVGMLGQSMGGSVAAQLLHDDSRVDAGVNLDGGYVGPVARTGVAKPFLQMASESHTRRTEPTWKSFWDASTGWKRELRLIGARHGSFTDLQALLPQLTGELKSPLAAEFVGTIDPTRSISAQRAYVTAFFDRHLRGRPTRLFDGPSRRHPEVRLVP